MSDETFLSSKGFNGDPFASTNSENEESLSDYFVPPPYFESVLGSPESPKSTIVFAPRGSGKTAQRRMIEIASQEGGEKFVCITYSDFTGIDPENVSLADHHRRISQLLTIAILGHLEGGSERGFDLSENNKQIVKYAAVNLLNDLNQRELSTAISSVKSFGDKASDLWKRHGGVLALGVNAVLRKLGIDDVSVPAEVAMQKAAADEMPSYLYPRLVNCLCEIGFTAIYLLIDKVDEADRTGNSPDLSFDLVRPILMDLPTIEQPRVAYKFFLWDQLEELFVDSGGRSDRIAVSQLRWTVPELAEMLSRRLKAFSNQNIDSFNFLVEERIDFDVHKLLAYLSPDSPRDMIRMCNHIISEHTRQPQYKENISEFTILKGIGEFSKIRSKELFGKYMKDLLRVPEPSFTVNKLASEVFKISSQAVRNKVIAWQEAGAVEKIGEVGQGAKPVHTYAFKDPRMAFVSANPAGVKKILGEQLFVCSVCSVMRIGSNLILPCHECGAEAEVSLEQSLLSFCSTS